MKNLKYLTFIILLTLVSCSKSSSEDKNVDPEETNKAPKVFNLLEVADNAIDIELMPSFNWQTATDPDGDTVTYDFIMDTNASPTTTISSNQSETQFDVTSDLEANTKYFWRVLARDTEKNVTESTIFSFSTIAELLNQAPESFGLLTLEDNTLEATLSPTFTWEESLDLDGDTVTYDFYLDTNAEPTAKIASDIEQTSFSPNTSLSFDTVYYWTVIAKDENENTTSTQTFSFVTQQDNTSFQVPFAVIEEVPIFPGCENLEDKRACFSEKMQQHITDNFIYPAEAIEEGIQGRVSAIFTISKTGEITNIRTRGPYRILENEVIRILNLLPIMTPGKQGGENVDVPYSIPITFRL